MIPRSVLCSLDKDSANDVSLVSHGFPNYPPTWHPDFGSPSLSFVSPKGAVKEEPWSLGQYGGD